MKLANYLTLLTFLVTAVAIDAFGEAGGTRGGGGFSKDEEQAYKIGLTRFIKEDLGNEVIALVNSIDANKIKDSNVKKYIIAMKNAEALEGDILALREKMYEPKEVCTKEKDEYALEKRRTPICFNLGQLSRKLVSLNNLVLLALHGHAHQFGWETSEESEADHQHSLAQALTPDVITVSRSLQEISVDDVTTTKSPEVAQLLFSANTEHGREGMTYGQAATICQQQKLAFQNKYFFVYCVYHEKNWTETFSETSIQLVEATVSQQNTYIGHSPISSRRHTYLRYEPVTTTWSQANSIYGIEVYALGNFLTSPTVVLLDSRFYAGGPYALYYDSANEALRYCGLLVLQNKEDINYTRAICEAGTDELNQKNYFIIKTQNPLLSGSIIK